MPANSDPDAFRYPPLPRVRRHGPSGYSDYRSYSPWLRDDFSFRCVYCLIRERWGRVTGEFDLDHFVPQVRSPAQETEYDNLLCACHTCNLRKGSRELPDASSGLTSGSVQVYPDGSIAGLTPAARRIIEVLCLNSPGWMRWRQIWIRILQLAREYDPDHYRRLMAYPDDLPDLSACRAPDNWRSAGVEQSCFERHRCGELPDTYLF